MTAQFVVLQRTSPVSTEKEIFEANCFFGVTLWRSVSSIDMKPENFMKPESI